MGALRAIINKSFYESFYIAFMENLKSCQYIFFLFFIFLLKPS